MSKNSLIKPLDYQPFLSEIKQRITASRLKAQRVANNILIELYWDIGKSIVEKQNSSNWGSAVVSQLAQDLKNSGNGKGFSRTNLFAMKQFYLFWSQDFEKVPQAVGQLPWGHLRLLLSKVKDVKTALFYAKAVIENGWSRDVMNLQIENDYHLRIGTASNNFENTLPAPQSDLAKQSLKDPYYFDFIEAGALLREREVELQLVEHISSFLLELGKGFAFIGRQYPLTINGRERFLDLLFYHTRLKCYVVVELKVGQFEPEYAGKMNYYLSAVDDLIASEDDNPTIGMILCKEKDKLDVEYALRDMNKPIGVSSYFVKSIPENLSSQLPTIEQLENEFINETNKNNS
jgi:predicted nuclease of restriction endonuclease-like (RecB) superfamily